ncbi:unnamed protein product [Somion occarium]|uniref:Apoptosis inhibitor 5 n=1 Tax=Somion occarium TaxID=3059160 RepID=A0ABP1DE65_9APHY
MEESTQLNELRDLLRRAERTPVKTAAVRKDAFKKLIDLAHSPYSSCKLTVAEKITLFIKDFPDLEDDAINAVYDLCEDQDPTVRIRGYRTISAVSKVQQKWIKRNADVLVQLLQSDDANEVDVVKRALTEHLDLDPATTLGVLCDQIIPVGDPLDEEEQAIRDRLRSLVLAYLSDDAKRGIIERHASNRQSPAEDVLVSGLLKAIPKLSSTDIDIIVRDILLSLPTFSRHSSRGQELLDIIVRRAQVMLKDDFVAGSLAHTWYYLELATFLSLEKQVAHPAYFLRFLQLYVTPHISGNRMTPEDKIFIFKLYANLVTVAFEKNAEPGADLPSNAEIDVLRTNAVEGCPALLPVFIGWKQKQWGLCKVLLKNCLWCKNDKSWTAPPNMVKLLKEVEQEAANALKQGETDRVSMEEIQKLIRSILPPVETYRPAQPRLAASTSTTTIDTKISKASLPPRPPPSIQSTQLNISPRRGDRQAKQDQGTPTRTRSQPALSASLGRPGTPSQRSASPLRRGKQNGEGGSRLSLLSRIDSSGAGPGRPPPPAIPAKRRAETEGSLTFKRPTPPRGQRDIPSSGEWSIKGAASKQSDRSPRGRNGSFSSSKSSSLLERLNGDGDYAEAGERRGKKRTKNLYHML